MLTTQKINRQELKVHLMEVYSDLYKRYREGAFEEELPCYQYEWSELGNNADFYDYRVPKKNIRVISGRIKYRDAVENLYQLVSFIEQNIKDWSEEHAVDILKIKNLIYEVKDYSLEVPPRLGSYFVEQARAFNEAVKKNEVQQLADELRGESNESRVPDDARTRVIKVQIIAALCGINHLYRSHMHDKYDEALEIVENIEAYVKEKLSRQHENERESFGLIGLTLYLKGRLLSANGDYSNALKAYAQSSDAYVRRLEQKDDFFKKKYIDQEQYKEKVSVTIRRAALVSVLGVGYLSFVNSRISKALAALRGSRAALKQNVGAVYGAFSDILFFACRRAEGSSERQTIEEVIHGLESCRNTLFELMPNSHYFHRAGIELATALHYRAKADNKIGEETKRASEDYDNAMILLESAIKDSSEEDEKGRYKNQRLLTEALVVRSYIRRHQPETASGKKHTNLLKAEEDAKRSREVAAGNSRMECEALIALGTVQYEQARLANRANKEDEFQKKLLAAQHSFSDALSRNRGSNVRIEAVCYLKLAKLSLLDPSSVSIAHDYFKRWKNIENRVEHAYCHDMANEISKRLSQDGPLLIVNAEFPLSYADWENKLLKHLLKNMLTILSEETKKHQYSESKLHSLIVNALIKKLQFKKSKAYELVTTHKLVEELQSLNK